MSRDVEELISGYLDESLTEDEQQELAEWIKSDQANARHFAKAVMLHDRLQCEVGAEAETRKSLDEPAVAETEEPKIVPFPFSGVGTRVLQLAAAVVLMLAILYWPTGPENQVVEAPVEPTGFATVAHVLSAEFENGSDLTKGQRLGEQTIALKSGLLRLQFDTGVEVTLQGPAKYDLLRVDRTRLTSGLLTADVPPGAEGFRVDTPTAEVTDLGTSFGVRFDANGASHVSVFDGKVEIEEPESGEKKLLKEGEAARVTAEHKLESAEFDTKPFERVWPISTGIVESSEIFQLAPPWPRRLSFISSDDHVYLIPDGFRRRLQNELRVNISEPGEVVTEDQLTPKTISPGHPVRAFIIQHQPETPRQRGEVKRMVGSITFDRPILGVIVSEEELQMSSRRFSKRRVRPQPRRQLEFTGVPAGDRLTLSKDRLTLTIDLAAPNLSIDVLRVIVDARPPLRMARQGMGKGKAKGKPKGKGKRF